ncbi:MAG: metallophosphoesterase [Nitrososphaerales archaeon]
MIKIIPNDPALLLKTRREKILVIPDLHLGFEKELAERGIAFPSQTAKIFARLQRLLKEQRPESLIFLGDIKHGTSIILPYEGTEIPRFFERLLKLVDRICVIPGNHDGGLDKLLPEEVKLASVRGLTIVDGRKKISLIHGHAWPQPESFACDELIMAHHHFTIMLRDSSGLKSFEPIWVITRWNKNKIVRSYLRARGIKARSDPFKVFKKNFGIYVKSPKIIVMPTFNNMLGGIAINQKESDSKYVGPIFSSGGVDMRTSELYLLDGTYLGKLSQLSIK